MRRCELNMRELGEMGAGKNLSPLNVDFATMDSTDLPFRDRSIDSVVTDLPFGKRFSEGKIGVNNRYVFT